MFTADFVVAAVLLAADPWQPLTLSPGETLGAVPPDALILTDSDKTRLAAAIQTRKTSLTALAVGEWLADRRELLFEIDPICDLANVQHRRANAAGQVGLEALALFPPETAIAGACKANRAEHERLTMRLAVDLVHEDEIAADLAEIERRYFLYSLLRDAHCEWQYATARRASLASVRHLIGDEAFFAGRLPPPTLR